MAVAAGGGVRVGLARVGSMVGVADWLVAQAARSAMVHAAINAAATLRIIQSLFTVKWNGICRDQWHRYSADHPGFLQDNLEGFSIAL